MRMVDLIEKKKDNVVLTDEEIHELIQGYTKGDIPDYQMSAFLMAVVFNGLTDHETAQLTLEMMHSGDVIDLSGIHGIKVDKHSTGGVGDKTSLVLGPMVAACGVPVAKMSGKGLGHTGGTLDKMESIPGLNIYVNEEDFIKQVNDIHLAIVDIMMPVMDGLTMTMKLREVSDIPVIFLTAKTEDIDKITGLNLGADDYITKPFEPMELIARVNSNLRRYEQILNLKGRTQTPSNQLIVGGLVLDQATKEVFVNGRSVRLTKKEFQILELLMSYPGKVYSAEEIYESIWEETAINTETIMVHVRRLREKIEANPKHPEYLKAVWGVGYKIEKME